MGKLRSAGLFYTFTGFEVGPYTCYIERVRCKEWIWEIAKFLYCVLCHFSVAIKEKSSPIGWWVSVERATSVTVWGISKNRLARKPKSSNAWLLDWWDCLECSVSISAFHVFLSFSFFKQFLIFRVNFSNYWYLEPIKMNWKSKFWSYSIQKNVIISDWTETGP